MSEDSDEKSVEPIMIIIFAIAGVLAVVGFAIAFLHVDIQGGLMGGLMKAVVSLFQITAI